MKSRILRCRHRHGPPKNRGATIYSKPFFLIRPRRLEQEGNQKNGRPGAPQRANKRPSSKKHAGHLRFKTQHGKKERTVLHSFADNSVTGPMPIRAAAVNAFNEGVGNVDCSTYEIVE